MVEKGKIGERKEEGMFCKEWEVLIVIPAVFPNSFIGILKIIFSILISFISFFICDILIV